MSSAFYRYTKLAGTIHLLRTKTITLRNPATWDDKNDAYFMAEYKRLKKAKTVLALCFAEGKETYHHWRVFSSGSDGMRIEFNKAKLLSTFQGDAHIKKDYVRYLRIRDLKRGSLDVEDLPFLKRAPYKDEAEFRVIYIDHESDKENVDYDIKIGWIKRVTISPWISGDLADSITETLRSIKGCADIKFNRSKVIEHDGWKNLTGLARECSDGVSMGTTHDDQRRRSTPRPQARRSTPA